MENILDMVATTCCSDWTLCLAGNEIKKIVNIIETIRY